MRIAFFIGSADISGGTYVIYQHALHAKAAGHDVTIALLYPAMPTNNWHPALGTLRFVPVESLKGERFDLAIATWWRTANELHCIDAEQYAYFVQSIESRFYPEHEAPLRALVDATYELPLPTVTEATWIQEHLESYGTRADLVRNGIRKDLYSVEGRVESPRPPRGQLRVLVEGPLGVFFKNVGRSLRLSRRSKADQTWLLTSTDLGWYPGVARTFSRVPIDSVSPIYRSCDVILKLSYVEGMFGPPLEMFHCGGTAVVYDVTGHDEYISNGTNALVLRRDDEQGVVDALNRLRDEPALLEQLKQGALATARAWPDWGESSTQFEKTMGRFMQVKPMPRAELAERNAEAMARYVERENHRLATTPSRRSVTSPITSRLYRVQKIGDFRRWLGYVREGWGA